MMEEVKSAELSKTGDLLEKENVSLLEEIKKLNQEIVALTNENEELKARIKFEISAENNQVLKNQMSQLENEIKNAGMEDQISQILVPSEDIVEMKEGKKKVKNKVFFPGYILIEMVKEKKFFVVLA